MKKRFITYLSGKKNWHSFLRMLCDLFLAAAAVLPLIWTVCQKIPFRYEVNDDAVIAQILDGSFTGTPDAHGVFVEYPLSWIMSALYRIKPSLDLNGFRLGMFQFEGFHCENMNWYVGVIVLLETVALVAVLFRMLDYFSCCRLIICGLYDLGFLFIWLKCFTAVTFSTAAAFCGCMALLFLAFSEKQKLWRPWNLIVLGILLSSAYCLRSNCFYMILPFAGMELLWKYHLDFLHQAKPWAVLFFCGILSVGLIVLNGRMYGSQGWKQYKIYNHARAYLQDYVGFPEYEEHREFYDSLGIDGVKREAMARYSYCMADDFDTRWVEETYRYQKGLEPQISWKEKIKKAEKKAKEYLLKKEQGPEELRFFSFYVWILLPPLYITTVLFCFKRENPGKQAAKHLWNLACGAAMAGFLWMEWIYLAIGGRFPQRVEETIRLLTLTVGIILAGHLLYIWKENDRMRFLVILQILLLVFLSRQGNGQAWIEEISGEQRYYLMYASEKAEVLSYCGEHPKNQYVLDTRSFTKASRPSDDTRQGNWFMSASWSAFTPLYYDKLAASKTKTLGADFLKRDNVYVITKGKKNIAALMGIGDKNRVEVEIVDEIMTSTNNFFEVYKVKRVK